MLIDEKGLAGQEVGQGKKKLPLRQCIGCRQMKNKKSMIRVVRTQTGELVLDATGKQNGRGAYLCPDPECLAKAVKTHGLERSLKQPVPDEVYEELKKELSSIGQPQEDLSGEDTSGEKISG